MHKQNNWFPDIQFNFVCIYKDSSVENSWFWKKSIQFAMKSGILLAFQNYQEVNLIFKMATPFG